MNEEEPIPNTPEAAPPVTDIEGDVEEPPAPRPLRRVGIGFLSALLVAALVGGVAGGAIVRGVIGQDGVVVQTEGGSSAPAPAPPPGSVAELVQRIKPSVVSVFTQLSVDISLQVDPPEGAGTGFFMDKKGHIVTNAHVIEDAEKVEVVLADGSRLEAEIVGRDQLTDLAVLRVKSTDVEPLPLGDSGQLLVGQPVIAIGNALNLEGGPTVTEGIVSALNRSISTSPSSLMENLIQTDAAINPGNSGGPLLDLNGSVVGINTAIAGGAQNIGFSISMNEAKPIFEELIRSGRIRRPYLGVSMLDVDRDVANAEGLSVNDGALVIQVVTGSAAEGMDLRSGDVIVEFEGERVRSADDVASAINDRSPGERISLVIVRDRDRITVEGTLGERP